MNQLWVLIGAFSYEFRMQIRRRAVSITLILIALLMSLLLGQAPEFHKSLVSLNNYPLLTVITVWTNIINAVLPIGVGVLLADRLPRDRRTRMDELFAALPGALSVRLIGKYLGSMFATLTPIFISWHPDTE